LEGDPDGSRSSSQETPHAENKRENAGGSGQVKPASAAIETEASATPQSLTEP